MATVPFEVWASNRTVGDGLKIPTVAAQGEGFVCGPADPEVFNQLFNWLTAEAIRSCGRIDALFLDDITDDASVAQLNAQLQTAQTDITDLQALSASNQSRVTANESGIASAATSIGGINATLTSYGSRITALEAVDQNELDGVAGSEFYHDLKANPQIRMGSSTATNYDGIVYSEADNSFTFKADAALAGDAVGGSWLRADRLSLSGGPDVSLTSTDNPFQIGDITSTTWMKADNTEIFWRNGAESGSLGYNSIMSKSTDIDRYSAGNVDFGAPGVHTTTVNFNGGGVSATVNGDFDEITMTRIHDVCHLSIQHIIDTPVDSATENFILVEIDMAQLGIETGFFTTMVGRRTTGHATFEVFGQTVPSPFDGAIMAAECIVQPAANLITIRTRDTRYADDTSILGDRLRIQLSATFQIGGF